MSTQNIAGFTPAKLLAAAILVAVTTIAVIFAYEFFIAKNYTPAYSQVEQEVVYVDLRCITGGADFEAGFLDVDCSELSN